MFSLFTQTILHPPNCNNSLSVPEYILLLILCTGKKETEKIGFYRTQNSQMLKPYHEMTSFAVHSSNLFVWLHLTLIEIPLMPSTTKRLYTNYNFWWLTRFLGNYWWLSWVSTNTCFYFFLFLFFNLRYLTES